MVEYSKPIVMDDGNLYLPNHMIIGGIPLILKNQMNELLIPNNTINECVRLSHMMILNQ